MRLWPDHRNYAYIRGYASLESTNGARWNTNAYAVSLATRRLPLAFLRASRASELGKALGTHVNAVAQLP